MRVSIVKVFDYDCYPGWAECTMVDAYGRSHSFLDKIPIFTNSAIGPESKFPLQGHIRCELVREWADHNGQVLVQVDTIYPDGVESTDGLSEFVVGQGFIR